LFSLGPRGAGCKHENCDECDDSAASPSESPKILLHSLFLLKPQKHSTRKSARRRDVGACVANATGGSARRESISPPPDDEDLTPPLASPLFPNAVYKAVGVVKRHAQR